MENQKIYKYKELTFTPVKKNLKFHKENYSFIKKISESIVSDDKKTVDEEKFWEYIHTEENIKEILFRLLDGEKEKIVIDVETDDDYSDLISLVTEVINDFFSNYSSLMKTKR